MQQTDPIIQPLLQFWVHRRRPNSEERAQLPPATLTLLKQWDCLVEQDGVLYRQVFRPNGAVSAVVA